jgi:hypothetical protein
MCTLKLELCRKGCISLESYKGPSRPVTAILFLVSPFQNRPQCLFLSYVGSRPGGVCVSLRSYYDYPMVVYIRIGRARTMINERINLQKTHRLLCVRRNVLTGLLLQSRPQVHSFPCACYIPKSMAIRSRSTKQTSCMQW